MKKILNLSLKVKMIIMILSVTIIPIIVLSGLVIKLSSDSLLSARTDALNQTRESKRMELINNIKEHVEDMTFVAATTDFQEAVMQLKEYHMGLSIDPAGPYPTNLPEYKKISSRIQPFFSSILTTWGYYDVLLICRDHGHIMYSALGEDDLGTNLSTGPYKNTGLALVWENVIRNGKTSMVDFSYYEPSKEQAAFIGIPVFNKDNEIHAVLVLQEGVETIENIFNSKILGVEHGEVYMVGNDYIPRSTISEITTDGAQDKIESPSIIAALNHQTGSGIIENYKGDKVLNSYSHAGLDEADFLEADFDWGIIAEEKLNEVLKPVNRLRLNIILINLAIIILVIFAALYYANDLSRPIKKLSVIAKKIGEGDLSAVVDRTQRKDEIGILRNAVASMTENLKKQAEDITEGVNILTASTSQISTTLKQFTASSQETVTSVTETTATVEEVRQTIQVAMDRAKEISESTQKTIDVSNEGESSVEEAIRGMNNINDQMSLIAESIMALSEQTQAIGDIVNTINDLAEQSNLLAVNAAIEAAKAGEEGKGFSVVAGEVKNLADQSKQATNRVREILNDVQKATSDTVMATEQGTKAVRDGLTRVNATGDSIKTLAQVIDEASQATLQIGASTKQQFIGIDQVNEAMQNINTATTQNLDSARQLDTASGRLKELGQMLMDQLEVYKLS